MGAFNTVTIDYKCQKCGQMISMIIQFKYGDVWQHQYRVGDMIKWNKNNVGEPGHKRVVIEAFSEDCPICGNLGQDFEVWLENDRIIDVKPSGGEFDFVHREEPYIILEE
jgi:hypothetical protein